MIQWIVFKFIYSEVTRLHHCKKSLKIPKGQSESVYQRRTDDTMAKRNSTKGSTKHTYKTKDRVTRTTLNSGGELRCSGRVGSSCSTSGTRRSNLVTNPVIGREWGKDREGKCLRQVEHIRGHLWHRYSIISISKCYFIHNY
jgi:hypothetical protein